MSDDKKKGISGIKGTKSSKNIEKTTAVSDISEVKDIKKVSKVSATKGIDKAKAIASITPAKLDAIQAMVSEEADKLFGTSSQNSEKRKIVEQAVKMAIEAAMLEENS